MPNSSSFHGEKGGHACSLLGSFCQASCLVVLTSVSFYYLCIQCTSSAFFKPSLSHLFHFISETSDLGCFSDVLFPDPIHPLTSKEKLNIFIIVTCSSASCPFLSASVSKLQQHWSLHCLVYLHLHSCRCPSVTDISFFLALTQIEISSANIIVHEELSITSSVSLCISIGKKMWLKFDGGCSPTSTLNIPVIPTATDRKSVV